MITSHPTPEMLADFAAGSLRLSHALCVSAHLDHCRSCRQAVLRLEALGAHYLTHAAEVSPLDASSLSELKDSVLDQLDLSDDVDDEVAANLPSLALSEPAIALGKRYLVPKSLGQFIKSNYDELKWTSLSPSIKLAVLCKDKDGAQIALTRVKPGGKMPHHSHTGNEVTVVLEGAFSDEDGLYKKGDMVCRDASHKHTPLVTKDAECICLAVLDSPIQFTGFFTRMLNPFVRHQHA